MRVPLLVAGICEAPIETPTPTSDHVEVVALEVLSEVVMEPEEAHNRLNLREQASVL